MIETTRCRKDSWIGFLYFLFSYHFYTFNLGEVYCTVLTLSMKIINLIRKKASRNVHSTMAGEITREPRTARPSRP